MVQELANKEKRIALFRSPTLDTVKMVEKTIEKYSGEFKKTQIWEKLPRKVMWSTFNVILQYLWDNNKIMIDKNDYVVYIWNPKLAKKFINRKRY